MKSGENGLIGPGSNNYGRDENQQPDGLDGIQRPVGEGIFPRRNRLDLCKPIELSITQLIHDVEKEGCSELLTDCVNLLQQARDKYSDFVDSAIANPK